MPDPLPSDPELLAAWLERREERAFLHLVERYAGLVHMAALRRCGDESLAAEVSQLTFISLARKANALVSRTSLAGWLHITAMMHAKNLLRQRSRESRKLRLFQSHMETQPLLQTAEDWQRIKPVLDEALAALSEKDRETLLLRFYRSLSVREIAASLGIATDAAQKRLNRATERLRTQLSRRGCQTGASLGAAMLLGLGSDAQAAVPAVSTLAGNAIAAGAVGGGTTLTTLGIIIMTKKATIAAAVALVLAGAGTVAYIRHDAPGSSSQAANSTTDGRAGSKPITGEAAGDSRDPAKRSRSHARPAVKYPELASKYGESRTNLSKHVTDNVINLLEDMVEMDEMATSGQLASVVRNAGGGTPVILGKLDEDLKFTDEQRKKANDLYLDYHKGEIAKTKETLAGMKKDPSSLMRLFLASDAFARGEINEDEYKALQKKAGEDLDGVANPMAMNQLAGNPMEDAEFLSSLKPILDDSQAQTLQARLDEIKSGQDAGTGQISGMAGMELEKVDGAIQAVKKMTNGMKAMLEGVGGLQDIQPLLELNQKAPSAR